jgi:hypothetical protein
MPPKYPNRPRDFSQAAKLVVDIATGQAKETPIRVDSPATEFARLGGLKGGKARAEALTPERRRAIARLGAKGRWKSPKDK